jgi:hypothetical protein
MNIESATMTVDRRVAREHYKAYRTAVKCGKATRDDVMLYKGYRALVRGQKVIDIEAAIGAGGLDAQGRPRLAVCRADAPQVFMSVLGNGVRFASRDRFARQRTSDPVIPLAAFPARPQIGVSGQDALPTIPPQFRPDRPLDEFHLLWEAVWRPLPTKDPMLLKHIDGPFYVVLAAWDLTPLEQAVMRQRL